MVARSGLGSPAERRDEVPCDHAGRRPIRPYSPSWVVEGDPGLFDWQTSDCPTGDLSRVLLKEVREEDVPQRIHTLIYQYFPEWV